MLKCNNVTRIIAGEQPLGFWKRLELKMHLLMCVHCRRYADQIRRLGSGVRNMAGGHRPDPEQTERMEDGIRTRLNGTTGD